MDKNFRVGEEPSESGPENENKEKGGLSSTGISPLAESLFLSPPSNTGTNYSVGKLVRCTSTPSYSSLFGKLGFDLKDPLFTANIQLDQEDEQQEKNRHTGKDIHINRSQDSAVGSYDEGRSLLSSNESDASSTSSSRGKNISSYVIIVC